MVESLEAKMRLTLNKVWELCLKQWDWVIFEWLKDKTVPIEWLKSQWMDKNGFKGDMQGNCFFCEYDYRKKNNCENCPGKLVDSTFSCSALNYSWYRKPKEFYGKILAFNKKRKTKK